ncbi:PPE domain-containing protein [Saccharothrix sp. MB29]|nr:PPE domain-containing protein [Saccharothrix sp. MB29]
MGDHRWRGYAHPELYNMINSGPGVAASRPVEDKWKALSEALGEIDTSIHQGLEKLGASWEGSSATETRAALSPLGEWATDAQRGSDVMKTSAQLQGEYIADARKEMPEPVPVTTEAPSTGDKVLGALTGPIGMMHVIQQQQDHERQEAAQDNAEAKAVEVMNNYQSNSEWNSGTLGEFVPPPKVVIDTPPPAGAGEFNSSSAGYRSTPTWTPPEQGGGTTHASWAPPSTGTPVAPVNPVPGQPPTGGTTNPSWANLTPNPVPTPPPSLPTRRPPSSRPSAARLPGWTPPKPPGNGLPVPPRGPVAPAVRVSPGLPPTGGRPACPVPASPVVPAAVRAVACPAAPASSAACPACPVVPADARCPGRSRWDARRSPRARRGRSPRWSGHARRLRPRWPRRSGRRSSRCARRSRRGWSWRRCGRWRGRRAGRQRRGRHRAQGSRLPGRDE